MNFRLEEFPNLTYVSNKIEVINLNTNLLTTIPPVLLDILVKLRRLSFVNNFLTFLPDVAGPSNTLQDIDLRNNRFVEFPALMKLGRSLTSFILTDNQITVFDPSSIAVGNQSLLKIELINNFITTIPPMIITTTENFPRIELVLEGNPLVLDEKFSWLGGSHVYLYKKKNMAALTRSSLEAPTGKAHVNQ